MLTAYQDITMGLSSCQKSRRLNFVIILTERRYTSFPTKKWETGHLVMITVAFLLYAAPSIFFVPYDMLSENGLHYAVSTNIRAI